MTANVQFSIMLMVIMGLVLYMFVDKRFKERIITKRTKTVQTLEIVALVVSITVVDILQFILPAFSNKLLLNGTEIALIIIFLFVDKLVNKSESFLG